MAPELYQIEHAARADELLAALAKFITYAKSGPVFGLLPNALHAISPRHASEVAEWEYRIQRIMREIDMRDLTVALKKVSEPLKRLLLSNISRRAAASVQEEMAFLGHVKMRDVEAAQFRIIDTVRKLESEGEIELDSSTNTENEMV